MGSYVCLIGLALRIIQENPDYALFENNCQNFAKYLLEIESVGT